MMMMIVPLNISDAVRCQLPLENLHTFFSFISCHAQYMELLVNAPLEPPEFDATPVEIKPHRKVPCTNNMTRGTELRGHNHYWFSFLNNKYCMSPSSCVVGAAQDCDYRRAGCFYDLSPCNRPNRTSFFSFKFAVNLP